MSGNLVLFSGTDAESALAAGASFRYNVGLGFTSGFRLGDAIRLAFVLDAGFQPAIDLTIREAILRAIETRRPMGAKTRSCWEDRRVPHRALRRVGATQRGLSAELRYVFIDIEDSSSQDPAAGDAVDMAALVDVDFGTVSELADRAHGVVPPAGAHHRRGVPHQNAALGVFYGPPHLAAGVTFTKQWFDIRPTIDANATFVHILMRYTGEPSEATANEPVLVREHEQLERPETPSLSNTTVRWFRTVFSVIEPARSLLVSQPQPMSDTISRSRGVSVESADGGSGAAAGRPEAGSTRGSNHSRPAATERIASSRTSAGAS